MYSGHAMENGVMYHHPLYKYYQCVNNLSNELCNFSKATRNSNGNVRFVLHNFIFLQNDQIKLDYFSNLTEYRPFEVKYYDLFGE